MVLSSAQGKKGIQQAISKLPLECQLCKTPLAKGTHVDAHIQSDTLEHLKEQRFPVPAVRTQFRNNN